MGLADELRTLQELRNNGTLSESEFAQAKQALLNGGQSSPAGPVAPSGLPIGRAVRYGNGMESSSGGATKQNNGMAIAGFVLGIVSIFLYFIGILPILAIVFSSIGMATFKPESQKNKWMAGVGLALGIIYSLMMVNYYGRLQ